VVVGVGSFDLFIPEVHSLKEKRSVVRKIVQRVKNQFEMSVAEVDSLDLHQKATIGFALVTNDGRLADSLLNKVINFVEALHLAQITRVNLEVIHV